MAVVAYLKDLAAGRPRHTTGHNPAGALAIVGLLADAGKKAHAELHKRLKAAREMYKEDITRARKAVMTVEGASLRADLKGRTKSFDQFLEDADMNVIEDAYRRAALALGADICRTFSEVLAGENKEADDAEEALVEAHGERRALIHLLLGDHLRKHERQREQIGEFHAHVAFDAGNEARIFLGT